MRIKEKWIAHENLVIYGLIFLCRVQFSFLFKNSAKDIISHVRILSQILRINRISDTKFALKQVKMNVRFFTTNSNESPRSFQHLWLKVLVIQQYLARNPNDYHNFYCAGNTSLLQNCCKSIANVQI